jgi:hypothetical protein
MKASKLDVPLYKLPSNMVVSTVSLDSILTSSLGNILLGNTFLGASISFTYPAKTPTGSFSIVK